MRNVQFDKLSKLVLKKRKNKKLSVKKKKIKKKSKLENKKNSKNVPASFDIILTISPEVDCCRDCEVKRSDFRYTAVIKLPRMVTPEKATNAQH